MGNSESMPRALHDNFLAVSESIKSRLGPGTASSMYRESSSVGVRGSNSSAFQYSFGPPSGDDSDESIARKSATRRKQSDISSRESHNRNVGGGSGDSTQHSSCYSSSSSSTGWSGKRKSSTTRHSISRRTTTTTSTVSPPLLQDGGGDVRLVSGVDVAASGAASSRETRGERRSKPPKEASTSSSHCDSTGSSHTPTAAKRVPHTKQAISDGLQQRTSACSNYCSRENSTSSRSDPNTRKQQQAGTGCSTSSSSRSSRSGKKQDSHSKSAKGARRSETRSSISSVDDKKTSSSSTSTSSSKSSSSKSATQCDPRGEPYTHGEGRTVTSSRVEATNRMAGGNVSKTEKDTTDWDAALDFADEDVGFCTDEQQDRRSGHQGGGGLRTRASSVKAASPRLFPSSPAAGLWPATTVTSPAMAISPSNLSETSSRAESLKRENHRRHSTASSQGRSQQYGKGRAAKREDVKQQEMVNHIDSSTSPTRSSSSSTKGLGGERRDSEAAVAQNHSSDTRLLRATAPFSGEDESYEKSRKEEPSYEKSGKKEPRFLTAVGTGDLGLKAAQAETHSEDAAEKSNTISTTCSTRKKSTYTDELVQPRKYSSNKRLEDGTGIEGQAQRGGWSTTTTHNTSGEQKASSSAMAARSHHQSVSAVKEVDLEDKNSEPLLTEEAVPRGSGCFPFSGSLDHEKVSRKLPLLLQHEEEEAGLSLLSPSYHLDVVCTRPATPTTDATTVGSSSSSAEEPWGGGRSRPEGVRDSQFSSGDGGGRVSPRREHSETSDRAAVAEPASATKTATTGGGRRGTQGGSGAATGASVGRSERMNDDGSSSKTTAGTIAPREGGGKRPSGRTKGRIKKRIIYGNPRNHFPFLEEPALSHLLPFLFDRSLAACMTVCPHWFMKINSGIEKMCAPINKRFAAVYGEYLQLWGAAVKLQPLQTADRDGVRIDWIIFAKVLPAAAGKFLHFGYTYSYAATPASRLSTLELVRKINSKSNASDALFENVRSRSSSRSSRRSKAATDFPHREGLILSPDGQPCPYMSPRRVYAVSYCLAATYAGSSRTLWIHRDNCRFHGDETGVAAMSSVSPVCVGDFVEVAVSLASGEGRVAVDTVEWLPLHYETRRESNPARQIFTRETCPLEVTFSEWFDANTFRHMSTEKVRDADNFGPRLKHERTVYSGFDVAVRKSTYRAIAPGSVGGAACRQWGFPCEILPAGVPLVCPLIRRGLQHDRFLSVQMRVGDVVEYYVSQGGTNT